MFTPVTDSSHRAGMVAGFAGSVVLLITLFSLVTFLIRAIPLLHAVLAGIVFAMVLVGGGALLRWYLQ